MIDLDKIFHSSKKSKTCRVCDSEEDLAIMHKINKRMRAARRQFELMENQSFEKMKDFFFR